MSENVSNSLKVPFDLYDFFGYLFPGSFFSIGILFIYLANKEEVFDIFTITTKYSPLFENMNIIAGVILVFLLIICFYLLGHIVASFGSLIVEKILLKGIFGYPYTYYLGQRHKTERKFSESLYKIVFFLINLTLILGILSISHKFYTSFFYYLLKILIIIISVRILSVSFNYLLLDRENHQFKIQFLNKILIPIIKIAIIIVYWISYILVIWWSQAMFRSTNVLGKFDDKFIEKFKEKFESDFEMDFDSTGSNTFWLPYAFVLKNCNSTGPIIRNFLHMFSFARNITSACILLISIQLLVSSMASPSFVHPNNSLIYYVMISSYIIGIIMMFRYFYIFSSYYTKFLFRAYILTK